MLARAARSVLTAIGGAPGLGRHLPRRRAPAGRRARRASSAWPRCRCIDPGDVTDLLDLLRDDHGLTAPAAGEPAGCPGPRPWPTSTPASVNTGRPARAVLDTDFPWCEPHADADHAAAAGLRRPQARAAGCWTSTTCCWPGGRCSTSRPSASAASAAVGPRAGRRVPGRQRRSRSTSSPAAASGRPRAHRRRRRRAGGVRLPRRRPAATCWSSPRWPRRLPMVRLERNFRSRQPVLDLANVIRPGDGRAAGLTAARRSPRRRVAAPAGALLRPGRGGPADRRRRARRGRRRRRLREHAVLMRAGAPQRPARGGADRPAHPVRQVRRLEVPRGRARQGLPGRAAADRTIRGTRWPGSGCCDCTTASARPGPGAVARCCSAPRPATGRCDELATAWWPPHPPQARTRPGRDRLRGLASARAARQHGPGSGGACVRAWCSRWSAARYTDAEPPASPTSSGLPRRRRRRPTWPRSSPR